MNDTYIPGFSNALQHLAVGGTVAPATDYSASLTPEQRAAILAQWAPSGTAAKAAAGGPNAADYGAVSSYVQPGQYINYMGGQAAPNSNPYTGEQMYTYDIGGNYSPSQTLQYKGAGTYDQNGNLVTSTFDINPAQSVRLVNYDTGETLDFGTGLEAAQQAAAASKALAAENNQGNWDVQLAPAGGQDWATVAGNRMQANAVREALITAAQMATVALPGVGQAIGKGLGLSGAVATGVGTGLASAAGRVGAGALTGENIGDALKSGLTTGAISGLTAGALEGFGVGNTPVTNASNAVASSATPGLSEIVVNATRPVASTIGTAVGGVNSVNSNKASTLSDSNLAANVRNPITVAADLTPVANAAPVTGALSNVVDGVDPANGDIVVAANKTPPVDQNAGALGAGVGAVAPYILNPNAAPETFGDEDILVEKRKPIDLTPPAVTLNPLDPALADLANTGTPSTEVDSGLSTVDKLRLGLLGAGLLGGAAGGGGSGTIPGGLGGGQSPIFSAKLPAANLPVATPRTDMGNIDYYRYGYGPEQSFFSNVPQGAPNTSKAYTGYEEREGLAEGGQPTPRGVLPMVEGNIDLRNRPIVRNKDGSISTVKSKSFGFDFGEALLPTVSEDGRIMPDAEAVDQFLRTGRHLGVFTTPEEATEYGLRLHDDQEREYAPRSNFAVGGPGDGREDKIPAMLSDGEYVIDAETVAMLGNGSNKAGAKALDSFRVNVRKHKGRKLAKGGFSVDAKRPEQYLKGRK